MITHQESTASLHEPETLNLNAVQLSKGHMPTSPVCSVLDSGDLFLGQGAIQFSNKGLLEQMEVLG
ncbi:MAG: hypothetical protein TH68_11010 [Candidatus Synechococcus spongiarum 142]|uniref:Uncharacterized protein n=1 Tax=Candidatus Synechococcus spongiarum 142 TaxID=1608213 RepID=A0A6N3X217_9SYNE|nr:MAG: hypothetical protein TH68_11010 [Candidatus Synechococcus spongiarum 142]